MNRKPRNTAAQPPPKHPPGAAADLPADGTVTQSRPEPEREAAAQQRERPATGITPAGAAGGRRI